MKYIAYVVVGIAFCAAITCGWLIVAFPREKWCYYKKHTTEARVMVYFCQILPN